MSLDNRSTQSVYNRAEVLGTFIMVVKNRKKSTTKPTYQVVATIEDDLRTDKFKKPQPRDNYIMVFNYTLDRWVNIPVSDVVSVRKLPVQAT